MTLETYRWPPAREFLDRSNELDRLERWWRSSDREPINLYGRRRVGKSWLFRRFAHGKPAAILVADRLAPGQQLANLADQLAPALGVTPQIPDLATLFRLLFSLGHRRKVLVVIDEFPYLLGTTVAEQQANLSVVQSVLEQERDRSKVKLVLTGSTIAQMEALQAERSPLHGRLLPLPLRPLPFAEAALFMETGDPLRQLETFAVAGGMPRYLRSLASGDLFEQVTTAVVDPYGPLFNEPRTLLQTEVREPAVYFSVLSRLAGKSQDLASIGQALRMTGSEVARYLGVLESLQLVERVLPAGASRDARRGQWRCVDNFVRFWYRFVQPYQAELEAGASASEHVRRVIEPAIADHAAPTFEQLVRSWLRQVHAVGAGEVGGWWGPALHAARAAKVRFTEEIDAVVLDGARVRVVGEAKWTAKPMDASVLADLLHHKLPALGQAGLRLEPATEIVLVSRGGFTASLRQLAGSAPHPVQFVDAATMLGELRASSLTE